MATPQWTKGAGWRIHEKEQAPGVPSDTATSASKCKAQATYFHWMWFFDAFSMRPTPSSTLVMS